VPPLLPSPAGLLWGISPPSLWCSWCPALFATCLFCCYCLLFIFFFFFPWVGVGLFRAMLIWPTVVCGSTTSRLAHLVVLVFPSHLGTGVWWQRRSPPGFSV
jgi:hypothetical protein